MSKTYSVYGSQTAVERWPPYLTSAFAPLFPAPFCWRSPAACSPCSHASPLQQYYRTEKTYASEITAEIIQNSSFQTVVWPGAAVFCHSFPNPFNHAVKAHRCFQKNTSSMGPLLLQVPLRPPSVSGYSGPEVHAWTFHIKLCRTLLEEVDLWQIYTHQPVY